MGWQKLFGEIGLVDIRFGEPVDTFGDAGGEENARKFEVFGYPMLARAVA